MEPDAQVVKHVSGAYARVLSSGQRAYAMYFDGNGPVSVTLNLPYGGVNGEWVDTRSGAVVGSFHFRKGDEDLVVESPEFQDGIALRITRPGK
jgi:hypothetical protein